MGLVNILLFIISPMASYGELTLVKNNVIEERSALSPYYDLSFEIKPAGKLKEWGSITAINGVNSQQHDFSLTVFFMPDTIRLIICTNIDKRRVCWVSPEDLPLGVHSKVRVTQEPSAGKLYFTIYFNGEQKLSRENKTPDSYWGVKIYVSGVFYSPANATLKNFELLDHTKPSELLKKGHLLERRPILSYNYDLSFDIKPYGLLEKFGNIIHLTTGGNGEKFGDRIPAIWFYRHSTTMLFCSAINGNGNNCWTNITVQLPMHNFSTIRIGQSQQKGRTYYSISINGRNVYRTENKTPQNFTNVNVYTSNPWYLSAKAVFKNYKLINLP